MYTPVNSDFTIKSVVQGGLNGRVSMMSRIFKSRFSNDATQMESRYNLSCLRLFIYLTTLLTSTIEFLLHFQNYVRHLNQNFREVRKNMKWVLES